jgi:hypothetical protein
MLVKSWSKKQRALLSKALRAGEPVELSLANNLGRGLRAQRNLRMDEVAPLVSSIHTDDPDLQAAAEAWRAPSASVGRTETITAVIPCNRGIPLGLRALREQDVDVEVLILSNGDGPEAVDGAQVLRVPWEGHGSTRAGAIQHIESDYVFFTVDDAIPMGQGCLSTLVDALENGRWDAVVARQIPWPDADAVTATRIRHWTPPGEKVTSFPQTDHVGTLMRTETLRSFPIPAVPIAEDAWWSIDRRVGYVPMAPVLHSHTREPGPLFERNRAIHAQLVAMGRPPTVPDFAAWVRALPGVVRPTLAGGPGELANQLAELTGQWWGAARGD